jgi:hypothetical protein
MAEFTRVHGSGLSVAGTVYSPGAKAFKIIVKIANATVVDLRGEDDALDETVEQIIKEINPLIYMTTDGATGIMTVICDDSASAADLQHRIRQIGALTPAVRTGDNTFTYAVTAVGPNAIDVSGTVVTTAVTLTAT